MNSPESTASWYQRMPRPAVTSRLAGATLRWFHGTSPLIEQPALDENVVSIHLGGPKRVNRWQGGRHHVWDVAAQAITLMPAFRANRWCTVGPIAYAHLTLGAELLVRLAREELDREPSDLVLHDRVGLADPLVAELMLALGREAAVPGLRRLYRDSLLTSLTVTVLKRYAMPGMSRGRAVPPGGPTRGGLAGWQLRRVTEHMTAHLDQDIGLDELMRTTGLSRAQFFRAFRQSTGITPAHYLQRLRMTRAKELLQRGSTVDEVARCLGYSRGNHFAAAFRRVHGVTPSGWRKTRSALPLPEL